MYFIVKYIDYHTFKEQMEFGMNPASNTSYRPKVEDTNKSKSGRLSKGTISTSSISKPSFESNIREPSIEYVEPAENKEVLVNADCFLGSILDYICEVTGVPRYKNFCMCTTAAELIDLNDYALSNPGLEIFVPKETYYIIISEQDAYGNEILEPILHKYTDEFIFLISKLNSESSVILKMISDSSIKSKAKRRSSKVKSRKRSGSIFKERKSLVASLPQINPKK